MPEAYIDYRSVVLDRLRMITHITDDENFIVWREAWMHLYIDTDMSYFLPLCGSDCVH